MKKSNRSKNSPEIRFARKFSHFFPELGIIKAIINGAVTLLINSSLVRKLIFFLKLFNKKILDKNIF